MGRVPTRARIDLENAAAVLLAVVVCAHSAIADAVDSGALDTAPSANQGVLVKLLAWPIAQVTALCLLQLLRLELLLMLACSLATANHAACSLELS